MFSVEKEKPKSERGTIRTMEEGKRQNIAQDMEREEGERKRAGERGEGKRKREGKVDRSG